MFVPSGYWLIILEEGLNESRHDQWRGFCEVLGFMRTPWFKRQGVVLKRRKGVIEMVR